MSDISHEVAHGMVEAAHLHISSVPVWAIAVPLIGAILAYVIGRRSERARDVLAVAITILTFGLVASMCPVMLSGGKIAYTLHSPFTLYEPTFVVDPFAFLIALVTSFVWMLATIYALSYMTHEHARNRFYLFSLLSLAVDLGVLLAGDLFTMYIFFELLAIFSYVLVIHVEMPEAMAAGRKYLFIGITGGLCLLAAIFLLYHYSGTLEITSLAQALEGIGYLRYLICALMLIGFGAKAGMFPVHVWLPDAHPVAPTPASALLSGVMIKAGAYGIFRTVNMIFTPPAEVAEHGATVIEHAATWATATNIGYVVIWIGIITMFFAVILALMQENSKRMLAYHSISQMGYIIMGAGCAAYLGADGALGLAGGLYHIINHALFKSCLFLTVGAVYYRTNELNMYKLGGLWREMPFTALAMFVAVMGISGVPGFNGFVSKSLLHHAIVESYHHHGDPLLGFAEIIFVVTAGGTFASNIKMFIFTFLGKKPDNIKKIGKVEPAPLPMKIAMGALVASIILIGIMPNLLLSIVVPATGLHAFSLHGIEHLAEYMTHPLHFFTAEGVLVASTELMIGGIIFVTGIRFGWFHWEHKIPRWFGVDYWYGQLADKFLWLCKKPFTAFDAEVDKAYLAAANGFLGIVEPSTKLDEDINKAYVKGAKKFLKLAGPATKLDKDVDRAYVKGAKGFVDFAKGPATRFDKGVDKGYVKGAKGAVALARRPVARARRVHFTGTYDKLTTFGADPIPTIVVLVSNWFMQISMALVGIVAYPYAFVNYILDLISKKSGEPITSISEKTRQFRETYKPTMPHVESIGFALFIVAVMLTIYIIYIALEYFLHF
ncbi:MAG: NADH dehydrogenase [Methanosarcinales archaeon]|nr:MAG: NADH dehydrogenase [Methanosarcinales archaeon]